MTNAELIASKISDLRKKEGLSQEELADKLFVSRQAVSKWERGEALPDTDNLISISKLFNVSLDELVGNDFVKTSSENSKSQTEEDNDDNLEDDCNCDDVKIKVTTPSIKVEIDDDCNDDDEEEYYSYNSQATSKKHTTLRILHNLPYPIIVTIAFLLWGFLADGWGVAWSLYVTIPVYYSILDCFRFKKLSRFVYPIFIAFIYCFIGAQWGLWHPHWVMFLTIPVFYPIANAIDKKLK